MMKGTFISVGVLIITGSMKIFEVVQQLTGGGTYALFGNAGDIFLRYDL